MLPTGPAVLLALAQPQVMSGQVKAITGEGLLGVNVLVKGASVGTAINAEGKYSLALPANAAGATLTFSFVAYHPQAVVLGNQTAPNSSLPEGTRELAKVVTALGITKNARTMPVAACRTAGMVRTNEQTYNAVTTARQPWKVSLMT
jgi:hypothetical protein